MSENLSRTEIRSIVKEFASQLNLVDKGSYGFDVDALVDVIRPPKPFSMEESAYYYDINKYKYEKRIKKISLAKLYFEGIDLNNFKALALLRKKSKKLYESKIIGWNNPSKADDDGWIYCYHKHGKVKIGKTTVSNKAAYNRLKQYTKHYDLGEGWQMHGVFQTKHCSKVEQQIFDILKQKKADHPKGAKELFNVSAEYANNIIMEVLKKYNDPVFCSQIKAHLKVFRGQITKMKSLKNKIENELNDQIKRWQEAVPIGYLLAKAGENTNKKRTEVDRIAEPVVEGIAWLYGTLPILIFVIYIGKGLRELVGYVISLF